MKKAACLLLMLLICGTVSAGPFSWNSNYQGGEPEGGSGTPGGSDTQVQFNDGGSFGGDTGMTYSKTTDTLTVEVLEVPTAISLPNGTAPTVDGTGEIAIDTTDGQLQYYSGSKRVLTYKKQAGFTVDTPTTADDGVPVFSNPDPITITGMRCYAVGGTSAEITLTDGTNALDTMTCDTDGASDDGTIANSTFTANEQILFNTGTVTGSVTWVNFVFTYTTDAE